MFSFNVVSILFILCAESIVGDSSTKDLMPVQEFPWTDEISNKMAQEFNELKASIEILKVRLDSQRSFNNDVLNVLNRIESKLEDKSKTEIKIQRFSNCAEALMKTQRSGIYNMTLRNYRKPFPVYCNDDVFGGKWTVIQRRQDGSVDFFRNWTEYKNGFGNLIGELFIGLDKLHALTMESPQELLIELEDFDNEIRFAKYDAFAIGGESEDYALNVLGSYSGNAGDSLTWHKDMKFSSKDRDNSNSPLHNCAEKYKGAWWYHPICHKSNLNGFYYNGNHTDYAAGITWYHWKGFYYSFKRVQMLIRPKIS